MLSSPLSVCLTPATAAKSTAYQHDQGRTGYTGQEVPLSSGHGFEVVDDYHFNITLEYPFAPFVEEHWYFLRRYLPRGRIVPSGRRELGSWHQSDRYRPVQDCGER